MNAVFPDRPPLLLAHITDLHARMTLPGTCRDPRRRSRVMETLLGQALESLKARSVDYLVLTGDLLDAPNWLLGADTYYTYPRDDWHRAAEQDYRILKTLLDESGIPYTVLAGNHDDETVMWSVFDREPTVLDLPQGYRLVRFHDREGEQRIPRRLDRERRLFEAQLEAADGGPQIHLQHYVVTPSLNEGYHHTYYEGEELASRIAASGKVALSLSGHYHKGTDPISRGSTSFTTGPCFSAAPHPCRVYTLGTEGLSVETLYVGPRDALPRRVVFLDRDGVLTPESAWSTGPDTLEVYPGAGRAVQRLHEAGWMVVVITNQSSVGYGYVTGDVVDANHDRMCDLLTRDAGDPTGQPDAMYYSVGAGKHAVHPDLEDKTLTKPSPALLEQACQELQLDPRGAWMVGDRSSDLDTALAFGARPLLVCSGSGRRTLASLDREAYPGLLIAEDLPEAVDRLLKESSL